MSFKDDGLKRLLDGFGGYVRQHGELAASTIKVYSRWVAIFIHFLEGQGAKGIRGLRLADIDAFFARQGERMKPRCLYNLRAALRYFLRWLYVEGELATDLGHDLPRPPRFSADQRPKYLPWGKIEELLGGIDRSTPAGKRDYAVLTLLACHGLRAGEAAKLRMQDIDLNEGSVFLRERKSGRCARLPLSPRAKEALEDYLRMRGNGLCAEVFLNVQPRASTAATISDIARTHLRRRFPNGLPSCGAHVLRHSFAKSLLDRGARLADVGMMLGHRNLRSTLIYARIATEELREVADNYARFL